MPLSKRSLTIVFNDAAEQDAELQSFVSRLQRLGHDVQKLSISQIDRIGEFDSDVVVAAGGDGTVNAVASTLLKRKDTMQSLGIIPYGTGNDFATAAGIPCDDPDEALQIILTGEPKRIDVGRMGERYFVNVVSGGFGAEVTADTPDELKSALGKLAYTITGLGRIFQSDERHIVVRGEDFAWEGSLLLLSIANGRLAGGGYHVASDAILDDGLFDILIVPDAGVLAAPTVLVELFNAGTIDTDFVQFTRSPWLEVETNKGIQLSVDGESVEAHSFRIEIEPQRLAVILPEEAPLVGG